MQIFKYKKTISVHKYNRKKIVPCFNVSRIVFQYTLQWSTPLTQLHDSKSTAKYHSIKAMMKKLGCVFLPSNVLACAHWIGVVDLKIISTCKISHVKLKPKVLYLPTCHSRKHACTNLYHSEQHFTCKTQRFKGWHKSLTFYVHNVAFTVVCRHNEMNAPLKYHNVRLEIVTFMLHTLCIYMPMYTLYVFCCHQLQNCENERNTPGKYHSIRLEIVTFTLRTLCTCQCTHRMLLALQNCICKQNESNPPGKYHNVRLHICQHTHCICYHCRIVHHDKRIQL